MSQRPAFHPSTREGLTENWLNEAVETTIEPGSTMKMFTVLQQLKKKNGIQMTYFKSGQYTLYDRTIRDHNQYRLGNYIYSLKVSKGLRTFRWLIYWNGWVIKHLLSICGNLDLGKRPESIYRMKHQE